MKKMNKKGFTVVELVIVIAVIAVLAAVLIPTFAGILHKADVSNDTQLVKNLNTALAADTTKNVTMTDALEAAAEFGYDIEKINASATDNEILWDSANNLFCYFNEGKIEYIPEANRTVTDVKDHQYWVISDTIGTKYSTYYTGVALTGEVPISTGFDAGITDTSAAIVTYTNTGAAQTVAIRMNGGKLVVDAEKDTVNKFGEAEFVDIKAVAMASFHEYGKTQFTQITKGNYVVESTGYTNAIVDNSTVAGAVTISTERAIGGAEIPKYIISEIKEENPEANVEDIIANIQAGATKFAGGEGTEKNPYLIETAEHMQNITEYYEKGYNFFKVKDGVKAIDCNGWVSVKLYGSFDGNGVVFNNVTARLFGTVGYQNNEDEITLKNFDANMNIVASSAALVGNIFNTGVTTFENVDVHGYIEGSYNSASYYNYGTCNYDGIGADYTVNFVNCKSDATLVCTSGNTMAGFVGNAYEGNENVFTLNVDENSDYTGTIYTIPGTGRKYIIMNTNYGKMIFNGVENFNYETSAENKYENVQKLNVVKPVKGETAVTVEKQANVAKIAVILKAQITAYDENGVKIDNLAGMTWNISTTEITEFAADVIELYAVNYTDAEIVNGADECKLEVVDGVLTLYTDSNINYRSGNFQLQVNQYDINGNIVACGTVTLAEIPELQ